MRRRRIIRWQRAGRGLNIARVVRVSDRGQNAEHTVSLSTVRFDRRDGFVQKIGVFGAVKLSVRLHRRVANVKQRLDELILFVTTARVVNARDELVIVTTHGVIARRLDVNVAAARRRARERQL